MEWAEEHKGLVLGQVGAGLGADLSQSRERHKGGGDGKGSANEEKLERKRGWAVVMVLGADVDEFGQMW